jgi:aminoacylase
VPSCNRVISLQASEKDTLRVFYGERAPWWVKVVSTGQTGHGSQLLIKDNATIKLVRFEEN